MISEGIPGVTVLILSRRLVPMRSIGITVIRHGAQSDGQVRRFCDAMVDLKRVKITWNISIYMLLSKYMYMYFY